MKLIASLIAAVVISFSLPALAQNASQSGKPPLKAEELDQLVSPIALYPDNLLSQVLIASTYPLEVVQADRWVKDNKSLKGNALKTAADKQGWDDSIKSLTAVPDVLTMMSSQLDWTQKLGDAVLAQQPDMMDAVQRLRAKADANDKLKTTPQQKVTKSAQGGRQTIVIEPAVPETLYVPYYDPAVVYGAWPYAEYPPYYFPAPGYIAGGVIATGIAFATGVAVGAWVGRGNWWGGSFNWGNNNININNDIDINKRNNWVHNPDHRHGVRYNNDTVRNKFAKGDVGNRDNRMDFRGRDGQQVLRPDSRDLKPGDAKAGARDRESRPGDRAGGRDGKPGGDRQASRPGSDKAGQHRPDRNKPSSRPSGGRDGAMSHIDRGARERASGNRGRASAGGTHFAGGPRPGGGAIDRGGGPRPGGGFHAGGGRPGGGAARGGGGRRR